MNAHATLTGTRGNPGYADPELWMPLPVTENCYVYSFGVVLHEILGKKLDARRSMNSVVRKLKEEEEISMSISVSSITSFKSCSMGNWYPGKFN
ncbi:hypothetical protein C4D60_Mb07t07880 [Musa balbisiana]|uniref:Protein kinase domain-containing protein n=1 Tax=Musa balbisiana TaxID=52838 RepID=A0A4S8JDQ1_MUSBA|nr:hypothetical protein C4D60_Mb07t07880 [Musa balbisiana]